MAKLIALPKQLWEPNLLVPWRKPVGPVIVNRSHWAGQNCVLCVVNTDGSTTSRNIVDGSPIIPSGSSCLLHTGIYGHSLYKSADDNDVWELAEPVVLTPKEFTVIFIYKSDTTSAFANVLFGETLPGAAGGYFYNRYNNYLQTKWDGEVWTSQTSTLKLTDLDYHFYALTMHDAGNRIFWLDGDKETPADAHWSGYTLTIKYLGGAWASGYGILGKMPFIAAFNQKFSDSQILSLYRDPYQFLKAANDAPFLFSVVGGAITGTGDLDAVSAVVDGSAAVGHTGKGDLDASVAAISGAGLINHTAVGDLTASVAVVDGSGALGDEWEGAGDLVAPSASLAGSGLINHTGSGALVADVATLIANASIVYFASGALEADAAVISGAGNVRPMITGEGDLVAMPATLRGREAVEAVGQRSSLMLALGVPWRST